MIGSRQQQIIDALQAGAFSYEALVKAIGPDRAAVVRWVLTIAAPRSISSDLFWFSLSKAESFARLTCRLVQICRLACWPPTPLRLGRLH